MCRFFEDKLVLPGWACCWCHTYNGLQRRECKRCTTPRCTIVIPEHVQLHACGFGWSGTKPARPTCPACNEAW